MTIPGIPSKKAVIKLIIGFFLIKHFTKCSCTAFFLSKTLPNIPVHVYRHNYTYLNKNRLLMKISQRNRPRMVTWRTFKNV